MSSASKKLSCSSDTSTNKEATSTTPTKTSQPAILVTDVAAETTDSGGGFQSCPDSFQDHSSFNSTKTANIADTSKYCGLFLPSSSSKESPATCPKNVGETPGEATIANNVEDKTKRSSSLEHLPGFNG
ncbi:hypothetical protein H4219_005593 [Mycoemilia scoparia]|uniref:Uncharacterized protein n=1 Tax=Mycoemilia scoparia TaxID=417184 RepID=A0A9W7ZT16_9FUNG|nr:hypothetical protein H4219_005593 [Mycoemilia scoparia]